MTKRKLLISSDQRPLIRDIFGLSDTEIDQVKIFVESDCENMSDIMKKVIGSNLNEGQKILVGYVMGNTFGVEKTVNMGNMTYIYW